MYEKAIYPRIILNGNNIGSKETITLLLDIINFEHSSVVK